MALRQKQFGDRVPVLVCWKSEFHFPYLKAAAQELLGTTTTLAPLEQVFSHAGELYSMKRANLGAGYKSLLLICL